MKIKINHKGGHMTIFYSDLVQFRGSHYDFGYSQGKQLNDSYTIKNRHRQWKLRKPKFRIDVARAKKAYLTYAPHIWNELLGMRDALEWSMETILRDFGGYRVECPRGGCSTITNKDYLMRNYDYHPKTYEGRYALFAPTDGGYATIGPTQRIVGRMDGMNEHGLSLAYNFMHRKNPGDGFICNTIGRMILEMTKDVNEAVSLLEEIPHRHSFSYILNDPKGESRIIETTPRGVVVREGMKCTNHFEMMKDENRKYLKDSIERMDVLDEIWHEGMNSQSAFSLLNDKTKGVFVEDYKSWAGTIHTTAYFPKKLKAKIALGSNKNPVVFDFRQWLDGENFKPLRMFGEVDTTLHFPHMKSNVY